MSLIVSFDTSCSWRGFNNRSISTNIAFGSRFSNNDYSDPVQEYLILILVAQYQVRTISHEPDFLYTAYVDGTFFIVKNQTSAI